MLKDMLFKTEPMAHQAKVLAESRDAKAWGLLLEMGTGKTWCAINTAAWLFSRGRINGLVVVAPKSICRSWSDLEIPAHLPEYVGRKVVVWGADSKGFQEKLKGLFEVEPLILHTLVVNVEALATDRCYDVLEKFLRSHDALMVVDESTTIKSHAAGRTKIAIRLGKLARYRRILTGTPITQSPLDLFSQFEFLEHGSLGSSTYFGFKNQYAVLKKRQVNGRSFDEVVGYQRLEELKEKVARLSSRVLKKDCLDLPDKVYQVRYVELTPEQERYYQQLRDHALAVLSSGEVVTAQLAITQLLRLRQGLCNIAPGKDEITVLGEKDNRRAEVLKILEEAGEQKVLIWANFVPSIQRLVGTIAEVHGEESVGGFYGAVSNNERQVLVEKFQDPSSPLKYLVLQPATGGYGLTLTAATLVVYHDHDWSLATRQQTEDRAHRKGQRNTVTYIDLVAKGTLDERLREALVVKKELADRVTGDRLRQLLA